MRSRWCWSRLVAVTLLMATLAGCLSPPGTAENHAVRKAVLTSQLGPGQGQVDELIIRLLPGERRTNLGFQGKTIWLIGGMREREYFQILDPETSYLFIGDIFYNEDRSEARVAVTLHRGPDNDINRELTLRRKDGRWELMGGR